jgi:hypothetical protein
MCRQFVASFVNGSRRGINITATLTATICCAVSHFCAFSARSQGVMPDASGHAALNGTAIVGCWNFAAGGDIPENYDRYPEFLPFLHGWDFRINLPHTQFQHARPSSTTRNAALPSEYA